ncbi:MAG: tRNA (N6-isopentenyl adenosine(37)-C2)-methylthiotransferase MiaB [Candidatus Delongbacteria bacterium]|nr:tRNA (N6-isopentenyl adenosine(37)-C2)-methylthiotransferase MiaB [Candidatus Delongbacteria bacterium]
MNRYDADILSGIMQQQNFTPSSSIDHSNYIFVHTCSIRQHAEDRVLNRLTALSAIKKKRPGLKIILTGCLAQHKGQELLRHYPMLDLVCGPDEYRRMPDYLSRLDQSGFSPVHTQLNEDDYGDCLAYQNRSNGNAFISIMRGCNNFCSYCIVPYVRGRERSRDPQFILNEIRALDPERFKEITLLGQNVNSYRYQSTDFPDLLEMIQNETSIDRVRFMTSHPKDLSNKLIDSFARLSCLCRHIHLPFQSGSDRILLSMNRGYTRDYFINLVGRIRDRIPGVSLSTDVIVGYPGETEEDFLQTLDLLSRMECEDAYMYKYSPREGTRSADLPESLTEEDKVIRLNRLIAHQLRISHQSLLRRIGQTMEVMVERRSKKDLSEWIGRSRENSMVAFPSDDLVPFQLVKVVVTDVIGKTLKARPVDQ